MPPKKKQEQTIRTTSSNTSSIDLTSLSIQDLLSLKRDVDDLVASMQLTRLGDEDLAIEYTIKGISKKGVFHEAEGVVPLPAVLHPRQIPNAPGIFNIMFKNQVYIPLKAKLMDELDKILPDRSSVQAIAQEVDPGGPF